MFTGLIEEIGEVTEIGASRGAKKITVHAGKVLEGLEIDDSIAINGICLTVIRKDAKSFTVEAVEETVRKTTLGSWRVGKMVNLERALTAQSRLGGHFVQGHVDGFATVTGWQQQAGGKMLGFAVPEQLTHYLIPKGSITLDGVSLTIAAMTANQVQVALIPHTLEVTTLGLLRTGEHINMEADMLGKYVHRILAPYLEQKVAKFSQFEVKLED